MYKFRLKTNTSRFNGVRGAIEKCSTQPGASSKVLICRPELIRQFNAQYDARILSEKEGCLLMDIGS